MNNDHKLERQLINSDSKKAKRSLSIQWLERTGGSAFRSRRCQQISAPTNVPRMGLGITESPNQWTPIVKLIYIQDEFRNVSKFTSSRNTSTLCCSIKQIDDYTFFFKSSTHLPTYPPVRPSIRLSPVPTQLPIPPPTHPFSRHNKSLQFKSSCSPGSWITIISVPTYLHKTVKVKVTL